LERILRAHSLGNDNFPIALFDATTAFEGVCSARVHSHGVALVLEPVSQEGVATIADEAVASTRELFTQASEHHKADRRTRARVAHDG
jgi:hypothetical protein